MTVAKFKIDAEACVLALPRQQRIDRSGIATLELVMCMPVLLILMVGLVWLGFSVIGQSQVAVEARHRAWQQRFDDSSASELNFLSDNYVTEDATSKVNVTPLLDDVSPPESSHDIAIGTWDHNTLELNQAPNWKLYLRAAINTKTGGLQVAYEDARSTLQNLQQLASRLVIEEIEAAIREFLESPLDIFNNTANEGKLQSELEAEQAKKQIDDEIEETKDAIKQVREKLKDLEEQIGDSEGEQKTSLESRIRVQKNKRERLQAKLKRLKSDRKKMNG